MAQPADVHSQSEVSRDECLHLLASRLHGTNDSQSLMTGALYEKQTLAGWEGTSTLLPLTSVEHGS